MVVVFLVARAAHQYVKRKKSEKADQEEAENWDTMIQEEGGAMPYEISDGVMQGDVVVKKTGDDSNYLSIALASDGYLEKADISQVVSTEDLQAIFRRAGMNGDGVSLVADDPTVEFPLDSEDDVSLSSNASSTVRRRICSDADSNDSWKREMDSFDTPMNNAREEWINAVFGPDFFPHNRPDFSIKELVVDDGSAPTDPKEKRQSSPPVRGTGLANVPSYVAYSAFIPKRSKPDDKIGLRLTRLPLGLYVRAVDHQGEAYSAGVLPGSVLIDINGLGVLGEPSHLMLERMWEYEGLNNKIDGCVDGPVALRLIKDGKVYSAMLFAKPPFGISWASCGNFAMVQNSKSSAKKAGIRPGCLIASINTVNFRTLDHTEAAMCFKTYYQQNDHISVTLAYTPAESRTNHFEKRDGVQMQTAPSGKCVTFNGESNGSRSSMKKLISAGMSCGNATGSYSSTPIATDGGVAGLAIKVTTGHARAPMYSFSEAIEQVETNDSLTLRSSRSSQSHKQPKSAPKPSYCTFPPCPLLSPERIVRSWSPINALHYCISYYHGQFQEENFVALDSSPTRSKDRSSHSSSTHLTPRLDDILHLLRNSNTEIRIGGACNMYLLQIVSLICLKQDAGVSGKTTASDDVAQNEITMELSTILVEQALICDELCVRLFCILSAFVGALQNNEAANSDHSAVLMTLKSTQRHLISQLSQKQPDPPPQLDPSFPKFVDDCSWEVEHNDATNRSTTLPQQNQSKPVTQGNNIKPKKQTKSKLLKMIRSSSKLNRSRNKTTASSPNIALKAKDDYQCTRSSDSGHIRSCPINDNNREAKLSMTTVTKSSSSQFSSMQSATSTTSSTAPTSSSLEKCKSSQSDGGACHIRSPPQPAVDKINTTTSTMFSFVNSIGWFIPQIDTLCDATEKILCKTLSQKVAELAMNPWTPTKETALRDATRKLREGLQRLDSDGKAGGFFPMVNPIDVREEIIGIDWRESYILPSAHCPLLIRYHLSPMNRYAHGNHDFEKSPFSASNGVADRKFETLYRTKVRIASLRKLTGSAHPRASTYMIKGAVAGMALQTNRSYEESPSTHRWKGGTMIFDTRSSWGHPKTLSLKVFSESSTTNTDKWSDQISNITNEKSKSRNLTDLGDCWVDLNTLWNRHEKSSYSTANIKREKIECQVVVLSNVPKFDEHGMEIDEDAPHEKFEIGLSITTESISTVHPYAQQRQCNHTRMLLYKHGDDLRQEMLAIQFLETSDALLRASGLDLKIRTFRCLPVGAERGLIEWVPGAVPLSKICQQTSDNAIDSAYVSTSLSSADCGHSVDGDSSCSSGSFTLPRPPGWCKYQSLKNTGSGTMNPIQDFLRDAAYDEDAPYFIQKEVMDIFVKSCAGFCIATYLLGVGDRHLDNILLHPSGHLMHCDFSFILGQDPKTYIPMRLTNEMVLGMGGRDSDNYAKFISLMGAAFVALRRHNSVRVLMSLVRLMVHSNLPDLSINQSPSVALHALRGRFRLDLSENDAISFIEDMVESCVNSKMWIAVDTIHELGKHF